MRGVTAEEAEEIRAAEATKEPGQRQVLEGQEKRELEQHGRLVRGDNEIHDVRSATERGERGADWSSKDMRIPLEQLRDRYDTEVWAKFQNWAESIEIEGPESIGKFTLLDWMKGEAPTRAVQVQRRPTTVDALIGEVMGRKTVWTRAEAATLFDRMRVPNSRVRATSEVIGSIDVRWEKPGLGEASVRGYVDDVMRRLPLSVANSLPPIDIVVDAVKPDKGTAGWLGKYSGGKIYLNAHLISSPGQARETAYHELMHWVQMSPSIEAGGWRSRIKAHFLARRKAGGRWIDGYANKVYPSEDAESPSGIELPTTYFEKFFDMQEAASAFNRDPDTMSLVLSIFFS